MNRWFGLTRLLNWYRVRGPDAAIRLSLAYRNVFNPSNEDAQIVLADFADFTGFFKVSGMGTSGEDRAYADGMRAAYGRIYRFMNLTDEEKQGLWDAARTEALASATEGMI